MHTVGTPPPLASGTSIATKLHTSSTSPPKKPNQNPKTTTKKKPRERGLLTNFAHTELHTLQE